MVKNCPSESTTHGLLVLRARVDDHHHLLVRFETRRRMSIQIQIQIQTTTSSPKSSQRMTSSSSSSKATALFCTPRVAMRRGRRRRRLSCRASNTADTKDDENNNNTNNNTVGRGRAGGRRGDTMSVGAGAKDEETTKGPGRLSNAKKREDDTRERGSSGA